jgi:hypothetical protein
MMLAMSPDCAQHHPGSARSGNTSLFGESHGQ